MHGGSRYDYVAEPFQIGKSYTEGRTRSEQFVDNGSSTNRQRFPILEVVSDTFVLIGCVDLDVVFVSPYVGGCGCFFVSYLFPFRFSVFSSVADPVGFVTSGPARARGRKDNHRSHPGRQDLWSTIGRIRVAPPGGTDATREAQHIVRRISW